MKGNQVKIRKIRKDELPLIRDFPPPDWNLDLEKEYLKHYGRDYFYPVAAISGSTIVGTGIAVVNNNVTWLGTIIVREDYRNQGIGKGLTAHLIKYSISKGIKACNLCATELGLPVYQKLGFRHDMNYLSFKSETDIKIVPGSGNISEIRKEDYSRILELDFTISGERRGKLLTATLNTGFKYQDSIIKGYYLPDFGRGLIIADSETAGLELLKFRLSRNPTGVCLPRQTVN
jgi:GNAT superfamily N-acetyltransferase